MKKFPFCFFKFFVSMGICVGGGWLMGLFTRSGIKEWYPHLVKSSLTPPSIVFPIAWSALYFLMGLSLYLVWVSPLKKKKLTLSIFGVQLFFNFIWSFIFFYKRSTGLALIDIALLWLAILATMILFRRFSKWSTWLLAPYLVWVSFAFYLNFFIWNHI